MSKFSLVIISLRVHLITLFPINPEGFNIFFYFLILFYGSKVHVGGPPLVLIFFCRNDDIVLVGLIKTFFFWGTIKHEHNAIKLLVNSMIKSLNATLMILNLSSFCKKDIVIEKYGCKIPSNKPYFGVHSIG